MKMMKQTVKVDTILPDMPDLFETNAFQVLLKDDENDVEILNTQQFYYDLLIHHSEKSFIVSDDMGVNDIGRFHLLWTNFKDHYIEEWQVIFNKLLVDIDPLAEYSETKVNTPNLTNTQTVEHGHKIENGLEHYDDTTEYGGTTQTKLNTYDGTEHNSNYAENGGSDTREYKEDNTTTHSGVDTTRATATGTNTETKHGYKNSPAKIFTDDIIFRARANLRDLIVKQFANEFLFYDNYNSDHFITDIFNGRWY